MIRTHGAMQCTLRISNPLPSATRPIFHVWNQTIESNYATAVRSRWAGNPPGLVLLRGSRLVRSLNAATLRRDNQSVSWLHYYSGRDSGILNRLRSFAGNYLVTRPYRGFFLAYPTGIEPASATFGRWPHFHLCYASVVLVVGDGIEPATACV